MALLGALLLSPTLSCAAQTTPRARLLRASDVDTIPVRQMGERINYGADSLQFGELRLPAGPGPHAVVIVVHGGCWYAPYAAVRNAAPLADALTQAGVATWNVEYRRYDQPGGGWPGTFQDVAQAADHVRILATRFPLDTSRVIAIGHSAGAQMAAWLATRHTLAIDSELFANAPIRLSGVVALGGVMDLRDFQARQLETCGNPAVESVLGGLPAEHPARYQAVSPIERLPLGVPHVHVHGALDRIATSAVVSTFADSARLAGDVVRVVTVPDIGHHDVMSPNTTGGKAAIEAVLGLLRRP